MDRIWADLLSCGAMEAFEDVVGQCGLYPLLSALAQASDWLNYSTETVSYDTLDKAILASRFWDPEGDIVVRFFKQAVDDSEFAHARVLLRHGLDVHRRVDGTTAIEHACTPPLVVGLCATNSGKAFLRSLLDYSNSERLRDFPPDKQGLSLSLLHRVASSSDEPGLGWLIRELVAKGADINAINPSLDPELRVPPIAHHVCAESFYCATTLLEMGADPSLGDFVDAIHFATMQANVALLKAILSYSRINQGKIDWMKSYGWEVNGVYYEGTNLHYACHFGHLECTKFFVEEGLIGPETIASTAYTPLHFAALNDSADMIDYLVSKDSGVNVMTTSNCTPLHFAASGGHLEATKALVRLGASNSIDVDGRSPRMYAESRGHHNTVQFLDGTFQDPNHSEQQAKITRGELRARRKRMKEAIEVGNLMACSVGLDDGCPLDDGILGTGSCSPLSYALIKRREVIAQLFIACKASTLVPFICDEGRYQGALQYASGRQELISVLPLLLRRHLEEEDDIAGFSGLLFCAVNARNEEGGRLILEHLVENSDRIG